MTAWSRPESRAPDQARSARIETGVLAFAEGSALIELGRTRVLCAASVEERVPPFLLSQGRGWVTAEYSMLPRSTNTRTPREIGRPSGRTQEIQRLIGRALRAVVDFSALGERTVTLDCDVLQADGGTRTAAITGAYVALALACQKLRTAGQIRQLPLRDLVAAISVGIVAGQAVLDLEYVEDAAAEVDFNVVMTGAGHFVEVQGTAEHNPFSRADLDRLLDLAGAGIQRLFALQREACQQAGVTLPG